MSGSGLPRVAVIGCGGTISSLSQDPLDTINYPDSGRKLASAEVLARVPNLGRVAELEPVAFREISSTALTFGDWLGLRALILRTIAEDPGLTGIVVLHGTGSLEETAFFLHLTLPSRMTVVLTGAQRPLNAIGSDAPGNLLGAIRVAAEPQAAGRGVLVVMNDEIHSARDVVKTSTYRLQAFRSLARGALGEVDGDRIVFGRVLEGLHTETSPFTSLPTVGSAPRVDILYSHVGADTLLVDAAVGGGAAALVSAGFPPGLVAPAVMSRFEQLAAAGLPIALCSRAASGRVADRHRTLRSGLIAGEDFSPQKARIILLLGVLMGFGLDPLRECFRSL